ncbi:adenosine deaminase/editase [Biscogniauxia sp. FL1348]|nr:adenosine deaminase/editase [Biscogniauxia sp. FL1348]
MTATADLIASLVQQQYDELPAKRKPAVRDNGLHEWVPLSGIVAQGRDNKFRCISLATGMKCLPSSKLPQARGNVLHDWHAEVLAIRAFNRFVLDECKALAQGTLTESEFLRFRTAEEIAAARMTAVSDSSADADADADNWHGQPFTWREDVQLHMYCSEAPCGDASMELTMASQDDATPWAIPSPSPSSSPTNPTPSPAPPQLPGRGYFSQLGIVRRKPSRGDAPGTLSKSCSDKLALAQCASLLSSAAAVLVSPSHAYLTTLVLPGSQYAAAGCRRAFSARGRMGRLVEEEERKGEEEDDEGNGDGGNEEKEEEEGRSLTSVAARWWPGGYAFHPFAVATTGREFRFSRRCVADRAGDGRITSSNLAVAWTRPSSSPSPTTTTTTTTTTSAAAQTTGQLESTLSGVLQGRRQADPRGASFASRRRLWGLAAEVADLLLLLRSSPFSSSVTTTATAQSSSPASITTHIQQIRASLGLLPLPTAADEGRGSNRVETETAAEEEVGTQVQKNPPQTIAPTTTTTWTYGRVKDSAPLRPRRRVKEDVRRAALRGWVRNAGDEDFTLSCLSTQ